MIDGQSTSVNRRSIEFIWDVKAGPVMFLNIGGKRLGFAFFCHRRPERSFSIRGHTFPICSRCTGLLTGFFGLIPLALLSFQIPLFAALILMVPLAIDGCSQLFGFWESNNLFRLLTGFLFAFGFISMLVK